MLFYASQKLSMGQMVLWAGLGSVGVVGRELSPKAGFLSILQVVMCIRGGFAHLT